MKIRPANYRVLTKIFEMAGCEYARTQGDHLIYHYPEANRPVVIPKYREVPVFVIRNNMKIIGMSREKYLELLQKRSYPITPEAVTGVGALHRTMVREPKKMELITNQDATPTLLG